MARTEYELNPTAAALLGLFQADGPMTGSQISQHAETALLGVWKFTRSQIYRELLALEKLELLGASEPGPRDTRLFQITAKGEDAFRSWMQTDPEPGSVRMPILLKVAFGHTVEPEILGEILRRFRLMHEAKLLEYRELENAMRRQDSDIFARATVSYVVHQEEGILRWLDALPRDLGRGRPTPR